jgi:ABC-2 type transport system permease protein
MRTLGIEALTGVKLCLRNRQALVPTAGFPLIFMLLFSYMYRGQSAGDIPLVAYVFASILGMSVGGTAFLNLSISLVEERDQGILKRLMGTPLRGWQLLGGKIMAAGVIICMQLVLLAAIELALFGMRVKGAPLPSLVILATGTLAFLAMGFCLASLTKNARAAEAWALALFLPMLFIGGGFFPTESLPLLVQQASRALPLTHFYEALNAVMVEGRSLVSAGHQLMVLCAWAAVCFAVTLRFFRWE